MAKLKEMCQEFFKYVKESEEGAKLLFERDKIFQFEVEKEESFYLEIKKGNFSVHEGVCNLDWKGKDWRKMNVVWTTREALTDMITGRLLPAEAVFRGKLVLASRGDRTETAWLFMLFRVGKEHLENKGPQMILKTVTS